MIGPLRNLSKHHSCVLSGFIVYINTKRNVAADHILIQLDTLVILQRSRSWKHMTPLVECLEGSQ